MAPATSDLGTFLAAFPLVLGLVASAFRLDELVARPAERQRRGRRLSGWDADGTPECADPEPAVLTIERRKYRR
jgi:hypothetical protein